MRVLLTGAAGFIGSHVATALGEAGHEVVGVDAAPGAADVLDVRDGAALDVALRGVDVVCHQAAVVGAGVSQQDAPAYASHNDFGTAVLLAAMARARCRRLVLASSMVVYGDGRYRRADGTPVPVGARRRADLERGRFDHLDPATGDRLTWASVDEDTPVRPRSTYAASKVAQEHYAGAWAIATGAGVTALRYHNVYGDRMPRDTPYSGVAALFRSALEAGTAPRVFEDGRQTRDFVHVRDVAAANVAAVEHDLGGFVPLNVCSGQPVTIGAVAVALARARGGPDPLVTGEFRPGDVRHIVADPGRAADLLGFRARIGITEGLAQFAFAPLRETAGGPPRA